MMKEERILREWGETHVDPMHILHFKAKITAFRRAVIEECAKVTDRVWSWDTVTEERIRELQAAIRKGGKG